MLRSVFLCRLFALVFVLATFVNVTHAYEHDKQEHGSQECKICFIVTQSADGGLVDEINNLPIIHHKCEFAAHTIDLVDLILLYKQSRAPPFELISLVN